MPVVGILMGNGKERVLSSSLTRSVSGMVKEESFMHTQQQE
jgi:hypothetical protein